MGELSGLIQQIEAQQNELRAQALALQGVKRFVDDMNRDGFTAVVAIQSPTMIDVRIGLRPVALAIEDLREEEPAAAAPVVFEDHPAAESELAQECPPAAIARKDPDPGETHQSLGDVQAAEAHSTSGAGDVAEQEVPAPRADAPQAAAQDDGPVDRQQVDRAKLKQGPLDAEERAFILANCQLMTRAAIAARLNRRVQAVALFLTAQEYSVAEAARRTAVSAPKPAPRAAPQYTPGPRQAVAERPAEPAEIVPMWQRELRALLNAVGYPAPFTPAIDLEIIERQSRGEKSHAIALDLGIDVVRLRQRVIALLPDTGMQAQARLLGELRLRAGVEAA